MLLNSLGSKVDITLSLTIASQVVSTLDSRIERGLLLKGTVAIASILAFLNSMVTGRGVGGKLETPAHVAVNAIQLFRRLTVLVFVQLVLDEIRVKHGRSPDEIFRDFQVGTARDTGSFALLGAIPLSLMPFLISFVISSIAIIAATFLARVVSVGGMGNVAELDRLLFSIQFMFADTVALLLIDERIKYVVALVGLLALGKLSEYMSIELTQYKASRVWFSGIAMAWVNVTVQIIVPDTKWSTSVWIETGTAVALAVLLQVLHHIIPALSTLQGYIEWHLSNILYNAAIAEGARAFDVVLVSAMVLVLFRVLQKLAERAYGETTLALHTVVNICTLIIVNTLVRWIMQYVTHHSVLDSLTVILVTIVLGRTVVEIFTSLTVKQKDK